MQSSANGVDSGVVEFESDGVGQIVFETNVDLRRFVGVVDEAEWQGSFKPTPAISVNQHYRDRFARFA